MLRLLTKLMVSAMALGAASALPKLPPTSTTSTGTTSISTHTLTMTVLDTGFTLRPDPITTTTLVTSTTSTIEKRQVCSSAGLLMACGSAPTAGVTPTYDPPTPSDYSSPVCGDTSAFDGSDESNLISAINTACEKPNWGMFLDPTTASSLQFPEVKAADGNNISMRIDFHWLEAPSSMETVLFNQEACKKGFQEIVTKCHTDEEPLMTGGHVDGEFSQVPLTFFLSVDLVSEED